ncbi:30S ribosomal protein S16 [bacterium]|nr:30S ribosomal protein S16 [bacterium]
MLIIRLQRVGRKNDPSFRIVVGDSKNGPKSGKFLEVLGSYDPRSNSSVIKEGRVSHWIEHGAKVSGTVHNLLISKGIIKGEKINVLPQKSPVKKDEPKEEAEPTPAETPPDIAKEEEEKANP